MERMIKDHLRKSERLLRLIKNKISGPKVKIASRLKKRIQGLPYFVKNLNYLKVKKMKVRDQIEQTNNKKLREAKIIASKVKMLINLKDRMKNN